MHEMNITIQDEIIILIIIKKERKKRATIYANTQQSFSNLSINMIYFLKH